MKQSNHNLADHILAVVDSTPDSEPTLQLVKEAVARGARATILVQLTDVDQDNIRAFANAENLSSSEAEARYIDSTAAVYSELADNDRIMALVTDSADDGRFVLATAIRTRATSITVARPLAQGRGWRRAMAEATVPVTIAPAKAA